MKDFNQSHYQVVVVGGGPAGAMLAYLFAKYGISVLLIERQHDFAREFRGEGLSPSGQAMFSEVGLWNEFDAVPHSEFDQMELYFKQKKMIGMQLNWQGLDYGPRFVSQPAMLEMLITEAQKYECFHFLRGERVLGPVTEKGRVIGVEVREDDKTSSIYSDFVIAADGRFSVMRKETGLDEPGKPQFFDVVWCKIDMPSFDNDGPVTVRGYFGNGHLGLAIPSHDDKLQIGWVIPKGTYREFREMGIEGWMDEMANHVDPRMAEHFRSQRSKTLHPFLLDVVCDHYRQWSVPGMLLIGDAAHPMSPVGAQGINIALRDSIIAANHFVPRFKSGAGKEDLDIAALAFADERRKEVSTIQNLQARGPRFLMGKGLWIDAAVGTIKLFDRMGLLAPLARLNRLDRNPFAVGVSDVKLQL